jgi:hypothetical protein
MIAFKRLDTQRTINLVFSSWFLSHSLIACCSRESMDHWSDHYLIECSFLFSPHTFPHVPNALWKIADKAVLSLRVMELDQFPRCIKNHEDIDEKVDRLV